MTPKKNPALQIKNLAFKRRWLRRLHWLLPLVFVVWVAGSVSSLLLFGSHLSVVVTNLLSVAFLPFVPMIPLLRPLGMLAGYDALTIPDISGFILCTALYTYVLFFIGRLIQDRFSYVYRA